MRDWIERGKRSQMELASLGEVAPANVSRWLSGQHRPDRNAIEKILSKLPIEEATDLIIAWLKDQIPESATNLIDIVPVAPNSKSPKLQFDAFPKGMSSKLKKHLILIGNLAMKDPKIFRIVESCCNIAESDHPANN